MSTRGLWDRLRLALGHYPSTADEWAVRVQCPDVSRHEFVALDEWLKADPRNAEDYARVNKIAHLGLKLRDHPEARARLLDYPLPPNAASSARRNWIPAYAGMTAAYAGMTAVALCLIAALAVLLLPELSPSSPRYAAGRGEQRQVTLADGSRMVVNTDSEVRVHFDSRQRSLDLIRGEAFFEVAKEAARPFVVRAGKAEVRAIGTKFSVRRHADETEVVVTEGKVQILRQGPAATTDSAVKPVDLVPGHRARLTAAEPLVQVALVDANRATAWTAGNVEFDEATLAEVIRDVNRYTAKEFVIDDPSLNEIRLSGRFRVGDVESVKSALQARFGITAQEDRETIHLSQQR